MDGLEIKEIKKSELERTIRIDSEFYMKSALEISAVLHSQKHKSLTTYVNVSDGNHMGISDHFSNEGVPYYRGQDAGTFFIENSNPICIDKETFGLPVMKRSHLKKGDVLLSIVGTIGGLSLVYSSRNATCSCKLAILRPKEHKNAELLAVFLSCKYGQAQISRFTRGAVQKGLILEDMDQLVITVFGDEFVAAIQNAVWRAYQIQEKAKGFYKDAETTFVENLKLDLPTTDNNISIQQFSSSYRTSGRLDAEYYYPKYDMIEKSIKKGNFKKLSEISIIESGEFVSEKLYGDIGISYIRGTDITTPIIDNQSATKIAVNIKNYKTINKYDLAFSMIGSVGNVAENLNETAIVSNNLGVIKLKNKSLSHYVLLYLLSDIGQAFFDKYATRTAQPKIKKEDVGDFLIPILPEKDIECISNYLSESFTLRKKSKELLEYAKQAVEMAIEQGEENALIWLKEKTDETVIC